MEYIFGTNDYAGVEVLKTKGDEHSNLAGFVETVREFDDCTITDRFLVVRKVDEAVDQEGMCYDWYEIDKHNRIIDKTKPVKEAEAQNRADIDFIAMETGIELE